MTLTKSFLSTGCRTAILLLGMAVSTAQASNDKASEPAVQADGKGQEAAAAVIERNARAVEAEVEKARLESAAAGPLYVLPKVGKPRDRVGGGRRGAGAEIPNIYTLVPNHVAQTHSAQPVLYWYLSGDAPAEVKFELTLLDQESIDPLVDAQLRAPATPGLQRVALADYGVRLAIGEEYEWSVAVVPDSANRAHDVVSTGWVERVTRSSDLDRALASSGVGAGEEVRLFARSGLWYDALDAAYREFQQNPEAPSARANFDRLLSDASLPQPAGLLVKP